MSYIQYQGHKIYYEEYGNGEPLILLHGNTASSLLFSQVIPLFAQKYHVITLDFLGCGKSDRLQEWPIDLWYEWSRQVIALCKELQLTNVKLIGSSGGALAAMNAVLEESELFDCIVADSFEGLYADPAVTDQIRMGRNIAKQNSAFRETLMAMHGKDWEDVFDKDTETVVLHAEKVGAFVHRPIEELKVRMLLTGSAEDEMFPRDHYKMLFEDIIDRVSCAESYIFPNGGHPAMLSNLNEFVTICEKFFEKTES